MIQNFAIIKDGAVTNVISVDGDLVIQSNTAATGDIYNAETGTFTRPEQPIEEQGNE